MWPLTESIWQNPDVLSFTQNCSSYNHGSQFRESRKTSDARVRLDLFHDVCSAVCTWWSPAASMSPAPLSCLHLNSCPQTVTPLGRTTKALWDGLCGAHESMFCFPSISRGQLQKFFYCTAVQNQNKNYMRTTTLDKALPRWSQQNYASPLY